MPIRTANEIPRGSELTSDLCVVGGGPAGIALALRIAATTSLNVMLLESGGLVAEDSHQLLNAGENVGLDYYDLMATRYRILGGSSHKWAGWSRPLDELDFAGRPWVPGSGWPISSEEMQPYYRDAGRLCELESNDWSSTNGVALPPLYSDPFIGDDVQVAIWHGSPPTKFGRVYRSQLEASPHITTLVDATATEIFSDEAGRTATGVRVSSISGNTFTVQARAVILAAGALETTRLLLASRSANANGLGNENDVVGRYFMEHPHLVTGRLELFPVADTQRPLLASVDKGLGGVRARLALQRPAGTIKVAYTVSRARQERDHLLNFSTHLRTVSSVSREESDAYQALKLSIGNLRAPHRFFRQLRTRSLPDDSKNLIWRMLRGTPEVLTVIYQEALRRPKQLALYTQAEQAPNPNSRVTLSETQVDSMGVPRLRLDWQLGRIDKDSIIESQRIIGSYLETAGLGRLVAEPSFRDESPDWDGLRGGHHHLGTARMSIDPSHGVVNPQGEVHTVRNLYVADSSVFPSAGYANPLLTTVAWALRVADVVGSRYTGTSGGSG